MPRTKKTPSAFARAERHLKKSHAVFARLIGLVGPCTLVPVADPFNALVRSIISQQISTKAAKSISAKLEAALAPEGFVPSRIHAAEESALQSAGLSGGKRRFIRGLAERVVTGALTLDDLGDLADDEIAARLRRVPGIGPWTVDMFLIFSLGRPDVLPVGDLGLRMAVRDLFGFDEVPSAAEITELAEVWRPYRSVATWYLWRSRGFVPQSGADDE